jgi:hypothetical protein
LCGQKPRLAARIDILGIDAPRTMDDPRLNLFKLIRLATDVDDLIDRDVTAL